jgi:hypothetical protein
MPHRYHYQCRTNRSFPCFYDPVGLAFCEQNRERADRFIYDHHSDRCELCQSGGLCLSKTLPAMTRDFICLCPICFSGHRCEYSTKSFMFSMDQALLADLLSKSPVRKMLTSMALIVVPWLVVLFGSTTNACSLVTFIRPRCLANGVGNYLLAVTIVNEVSLVFLALRLTHIAVSTVYYRTNSIWNRVFCATFPFVSNSFNHLSYWLVSLVAIERAYSTIYLRGRWCRTPAIARRLIVVCLLLVLISSSYEMIFMKVTVSVDMAHSTVCLVEFPHGDSTWPVIHQIISIVHALMPLTINLVCILIIIYKVMQKKMRVNRDSQKDSSPSSIEAIHRRMTGHFRLFTVIFRANKEIIFGPALTLVPQLCSLPLFIASLIHSCRSIQNSWIRYLFLSCLLGLFVPQCLTFQLYITSSTFYSAQWRNTQLRRHFIRFRRNLLPSLLSRVHIRFRFIAT